MYPKNSKTMSVLITLLAAILVGCGSNGDTGQGLGFSEETRENEAGQYGVCIYEDGSECDTWDFLAGRCGQEHSYCSQQGFQLESSEESNIATCTFDDGSTCDEFGYFQGECKPGEEMP
jgi:putative hemolysin